MTLLLAFIGMDITGIDGFWSHFAVTLLWLAHVLFHASND